MIKVLHKKTFLRRSQRQKSKRERNKYVNLKIRMLITAFFKITYKL